VSTRGRGAAVISLLSLQERVLLFPQLVDLAL
jgi:hypothetical protein